MTPDGLPITTRCLYPFHGLAYFLMTHFTLDAKRTIDDALLNQRYLMMKIFRSIHLTAAIMVGVVAALIILGSDPVVSNTYQKDSVKHTGEDTIIEFADMAMPAPVLGVTVDQTMRVLDVESGSVAERAGVQRGDVIEMLDGIDLKKSADRPKAKQRIFASKEGQKMKLNVSRGGKSIEMEVVSSPATPPAGRPTPTPVTAPNDYF